MLQRGLKYKLSAKSGIIMHIVRPILQQQIKIRGAGTNKQFVVESEETVDKSKRKVMNTL